MPHQPNGLENEKHLSVMILASVDTFILCKPRSYCLARHRFLVVFSVLFCAFYIVCTVIAAFLVARVSKFYALFVGLVC